MKIRKYAAIDIGSNAVRLLVSNVIDYKGQVLFQKDALVRVPIRLGQDTFTKGKISKKNIRRIVKSIKAFRLLMKVHGVEDYLAYATSALRGAKNCSQVVESVFNKSKIQIEIIDGKKEAKIISNTNVFENIDIEKTFLYIDVGGGSTELSILKGGKIINSISFKIGTVRLLNKGFDQNIWNQLEIWIKKYTNIYSKIYLLGTGGNINKLHKIANLKENRPITFLTLSLIYNKLKGLTYEERIVELELNPDRSDVIMPATQLFLKILEWSGAKVIYVPKVGLSDGMIRELYKTKN
jgi:exopolyphosphatase/guanosine-5'-triphosphate,3'-diphosphate pyrophosphatase